jgi:redox-sensitive bicupin YhaK (pirin superfamily)
MSTEVKTTRRNAALVSDSMIIYMWGLSVREALPAPDVPYRLSDPFILVHEGRVRASELPPINTRHPHRGFDNLWYVLQGTASTGHSTGPGGAMERARLTEGSLLALRTGRGAIHAESVRADEVRQNPDEEFRSVLFWVNLASKDKTAEPKARVV